MKNLIYILLFFTCFLQAQNNITASIFQDAKLGIIGDKEHGYKAGTLDILVRVNMQGKQTKSGYLVIFPEFEYAKIKGDYKRYTANVGYTFNQFVTQGVEVQATAGYGWIDRYSKAFFSWTFTGAIKYKITEDIKVVLLSQLTERKELGWLYDYTPWRLSSFIGVEVLVFNN
ncbi:MAG: hypothetical protein ACPG6B_01435 [Oceanihabitans sp.]